MPCVHAGLDPIPEPGPEPEPEPETVPTPTVSTPTPVASSAAAAASAPQPATCVEVSVPLNKAEAEAGLLEEPEPERARVAAAESDARNPAGRQPTGPLGNGAQELIGGSQPRTARFASFEPEPEPMSRSACMLTATAPRLSNDITSRGSEPDMEVQTGTVRIGGEGEGEDGYDVPCEGAKGLTADQLEKCKGAVKFKEWAGSVGPEFLVKKVTFQSLDMFGPTNVGFIKMKVDCVDRATKKFINGIVVIRGHSVAVLIELTAKETGDRYAVMTVQARLPTPEDRSLEVPAGMMDGRGEFVGAAAKELKEETGIVVSQENLIELTEGTQRIFLSPGGLDEGMKFYLYRRTMLLRDIQQPVQPQHPC